MTHLWVIFGRKTPSIGLLARYLVVFTTNRPLFENTLTSAKKNSFLR